MVKLIIRGIRRAKFKTIWQTAKRVAKEHKRLTLFVFFDMAWCVFLYGAGYVDYEIFEFGRIGGKARKTFVTQGENEKIVRELNSKEDRYLSDDKGETNRFFADYIRRDWLDLRLCEVAEFADFVSRHQYIIVKTPDGTCGKGIEKIHTKDIDAQEMYHKLVQSGQTIVEECVVQHSDIGALYPSSVNTIRLVTIADNSGKVHVVFRAMRLGASGGVVDNFNSGGMFVLIGEDGIISSDAINAKTEIFHRHPDTNSVFAGTKVPFFAQSMDMVTQAATLLPRVRYIAWDVAVTENGPLLIELNQHPCHLLLQSKVYLRNNKKGLLPIFKNAIQGKI